MPAAKARGRKRPERFEFMVIDFSKRDFSNAEFPSWKKQPHYSKARERFRG
jgi:hypothetical protein